ncbi:MAG: hypothetical protein PHO02_02620 [Candidatus Nanoarchaeia archaeon]|nr:hypothetical protein [Candidatus Nanoarchaeia archaeon]
MEEYNHTKAQVQSLKRYKITLPIIGAIYSMAAPAAAVASAVELHKDNYLLAIFDVFLGIWCGSSAVGCFKSAKVVRDKLKTFEEQQKQGLEAKLDW